MLNVRNASVFNNSFMLFAVLNSVSIDVAVSCLNRAPLTVLWRGLREDSGPENPMSGGTLMIPSPYDKGCKGG